MTAYLTPHFRGSRITAGDMEDMTRLIDRVGLETYLAALSEICDRIADQQVYLGDGPLGVQWAQVATAVANAEKTAMGL